MHTIRTPLSDPDSASREAFQSALQHEETEGFLRLVNFEMLIFDNGRQNVGEYTGNFDGPKLPPLEIIPIPQDATEKTELKKALQNRTSIYYGEVAIGDQVQVLLIARAPVPGEVNVAGAFTKAAVANAIAEWEFFGRQERGGGQDRDGKKEFEPDASERVHKYWKEGTGLAFTGMNRDQPWSAAFISYIMKVSGAGARFKYAAAHRTYIFRAIRAAQANDVNYGYWGFPLSAEPPEVGDLICAWRSTRDFPGPVTFESASRREGEYPSHCDLVVEKTDQEIATIGGNVSESVTKKHFRLSAGGLLAPANFDKGFAILKNRMDAGAVAAATSPLKTGGAAGVLPDKDPG